MQQKIMPMLYVHVIFWSLLVAGNSTNMSDVENNIISTEHTNSSDAQTYDELGHISGLTPTTTSISSTEQSFRQEESTHELSSLNISQGTFKFLASSESFGSEQSKSQNSFCHDPMKVVRSEKTFAEAKFHANCPYDFQCKFGCFAELKRYNCMCDIMCWFHGDCCYDFYYHCLGVRIDADDSEIFEAILSKLEFKSQVRNLHGAYRLLSLSSCLSTHANQANVLINKCGDSPEIQSRFKTLYEQISAENSFDLGLSMEDVKRRCEHSAPTDFYDNMPSFFQFGSFKDNDIFTQYSNFLNKFCSFCNGIPPNDVIAWHSNVICSDNKTFTLLDVDSYSEFIDAMHTFNCSVKHTPLPPIISRYCFTQQSTYKETNQVDVCNQTIRSDPGGERRDYNEEKCFGTRLCRRYSLRFTDSYTQQAYPNPHCFFISQGDYFENVGHINTSVDFCRFTMSPCDADLKFSLADNIESYRQLFQFRTKERGRKKIKRKTCRDNEAYIPELNSCSPVDCFVGSIPIAGKCYTKNNLSGILSREHRVHDEFLPIEVASIVHQHVNAKVRLKVAFNNGANYVYKENIHCRNFFQNKSFTDVLLSENSLMQFWQSCIARYEKIDLVSELNQMLLSDIEFSSLQIETLLHCQLIDFGQFTCSEHLNIETGEDHNSESVPRDHESCGRNISGVLIDSKVDACLVFELSSDKYLELKYKLLKTYNSVKYNIRFEPLQLLEITLENVNVGLRVKAAVGSPCPEDRSLRDVRLSVSENENHKDIIYINYGEIPETNFRFHVTWSANLTTGKDVVYPDCMVVSLCVKDNAAFTCPSNSYLEFYYNDVVFEQSNLIISLNKTEASDFLLDLDILLIFADDIKFEMKQYFGDNFFYILPKSEYVLLDSRFLVCTSFLNYEAKNSLNYRYAFVPSSTTEKLATFFSSLLSIICLTLAVLTYAIIPVLRANVPGKIVFSLSLTLLIAHLFFLMSLYPKNLACRIYAAGHHAAWISSFAWQSAMAFHLSHTIRNNNFEETRRSVYNLVACLCWGAPLILASIFFYLDVYDILSIGYGLNGICWIGDFTAGLATFAVPVILSVLFSLTCCFFVINAIRKSAAFRRSYASSYSNLKRQILLCVNLSLLMGFGWIFYFIAVPADISLLWIPFLVCHGSQGFFIFVCFIAKKTTFTLLYNKLCV